MSLMSDGDMAQAGISAFPDEDNLFRWVGTINGPQDSPYEGLILKLQLEFPETYPYKPPNCQFKVSNKSFVTNTVFMVPDLYF